MAEKSLYDFPCSSTFRDYEDYWMTGKLYNDRAPDLSKLEELECRLDDLEGIVAEPGAIPRHYHDTLDQLRARVLHAEKKLNEHLDRKQRGKY